MFIEHSNSLLSGPLIVIFHTHSYSFLLIPVSLSLHHRVTSVSTNQKPVFGTSLIEYAEQTNRELSIVIEYCICMLNENLAEEGLFRVPGSTSKVKKLKSFFNLQTYQMIQEYSRTNESGGFYLANLENYDEFVNDPHSVAGCLKV